MLKGSTALQTRCRKLYNQQLQHRSTANRAMRLISVPRASPRHRDREETYLLVSTTPGFFATASCCNAYAVTPGLSFDPAVRRAGLAMADDISILNASEQMTVANVVHELIYRQHHID